MSGLMMCSCLVGGRDLMTELNTHIQVDKDRLKAFTIRAECLSIVHSEFAVEI